MPKNKALFFRIFISWLSVTSILSYPPITLAGSQDLYNQPYLSQINRPANLAISGNSSVTVAIIDEGFNFNHPDLLSSLWTGQNGRHGWNFLYNSADLTPQGKHGTEVAGVIKEVTGQNNIKLMSLIVCGQTSGCNIAAINQAIHYAADQGAGVINLSLGMVGNNSFSHEFDEAITYAYNKGVIIVAAAGNGEGNGGAGQNLTLYPVSPVCNDNGADMVLGVSSVDALGNAQAWANYGPCVDVTAPGDSVYTTIDPDFTNNLLYGYVSGTSYSAAEVSGLAALIKLQSPSLTNRQIMDLIKENSGDSESNLKNINVKNALRQAKATSSQTETIYAQILNVEPVISPLSLHGNNKRKAKVLGTTKKNKTVIKNQLPKNRVAAKIRPRGE